MEAAPIEYKGAKLNNTFRIDFCIDDKLVVEPKACDSVNPIHEAKLMTYMKLTHINAGLLINFNVPILQDEIKRIVF